MAIFQTKKIQSVIVFIIVLVAILWIFQDNILSISDFEKSTKESEFSEEQIKDTPYLEKIDNFIIKEYSSDQVLLHTIEADVYKSFKNSPVQLDTVKVTTFDFARYGGIDGTLCEVSATTFLDENGEPYYRGLVNLSQNHVGIDDTVNLVLPGMTVQADIKTGKKTLLEYLLKPVVSSVNESFRER